MVNEHNHAEGVSTTACPACLKDGEGRLQRAERGFSDEDAWSFNAYLARVIADGIEHMADNLHGCPPVLVVGDDVDAGVKKWDAILREIVSGFRSWTDSDEKFVEPPEEFHRAFDLLHTWWADLWD